MKRSSMALAGVLLAAAPLHAQTIFPPSSLVSTPSGSAGGDLSGSYPNPSVAKINGNSYPPGVAADQLAVGQAANTLGFTTVPDCRAANSVLQYTQSTHSFGCATGSGGGSTADNYLAGMHYALQGNITNATASAANSVTKCIPGRAVGNGTIAGMVGKVQVNASGGHVAFALYLNGSDNAPGALVQGFYGIATDSTGPTLVQSLTTPLAIAQGQKLWTCTTSDTASATYPSTIGQANFIVGAPDDTAFDNSGAGFTGYSFSLTYAAIGSASGWPASLTGYSGKAQVANAIPVAHFIMQ